MKASILNHLDSHYLVIPKTGFAPMLLLEQFKLFHEMDINLYPIVKKEPDILQLVGESNFCIEVLSIETKKQTVLYIYELFLAYINGNLADVPIDYS